MFFKIKVIVALPEAPGTVEVSITASAAQGSILIADTAPGELFLLSLGPLNLCLGGLGLGSWSWFLRDVKATRLVQGSFFSELLHDSLDGCLFILSFITVWEVTVLEGHSAGVLSLQYSQSFGKSQDPFLPGVVLL